MLVVVSPHFDDAIFGCGCLLAAHPGSTVVTVFTAAPADPGIVTEWDALCGFADAGAATTARRSEDEVALAEVGAVPRWLDFVDGQYGDVAGEDEIALAVERALTELGATRVFVPLGLFHADHRLVHGATTRAVLALPGIEAWTYDDAIYRAMPGLLDARLAELDDGQVAPAATAFPCSAADAERKARAIRCYASQAPALGADGMADTAQPETHRRLRR